MTAGKGVVPLVERLRDDLAQLKRAEAHANLAGNGTSVRVKDPALLIADLAEAASLIENLVKALEEARVVLVRIAGRDFDCSPHQHGMAAAGHAQRAVHSIEAVQATLASGDALDDGRGSHE
jgi:hypothetical protein